MTLMAVGLILIVIGIGLIALRWPKGKKNETPQEYRQNGNIGREKVQGGAIVMIGPIPIVIGSDYRITILLMLIALTITIIWVLAFKI